MSESTVILAAARFPDDLEVVRTLFAQYIDSLGINLSFQGVDAELEGLPGQYASPAGAVLLAWDGAGRALGCVALRPAATPGTAEMKRLYVRPAARGKHLGRLLAVGIMDYARGRGYRRMVLDTLASLHAARQLYASLGFEEVTPYYDNPISGALYLARDL